MKTLCVSLETAKALKAAGWTKPTVMVWVICKDVGPVLMRNSTFYCGEYTEILPCPTAEEVLRELPLSIEGGTKLDVCIDKNRNWYTAYSQMGRPFAVFFYDKSLSEAAAQMWLWCVENKYIEVKP